VLIANRNIAARKVLKVFEQLLEIFEQFVVYDRNFEVFEQFRHNFERKKHELLYSRKSRNGNSEELQVTEFRIQTLTAPLPSARSLI